MAMRRRDVHGELSSLCSKLDCPTVVTSMTAPTPAAMLAEALAPFARMASDLPSEDDPLVRNAGSLFKIRNTEIFAAAKALAAYQASQSEGEGACAAAIAKHGMAMAKSYGLGTPESRAIITTLEHLRAMLAAAPVPPAQPPASQWREADTDEALHWVQWLHQGSMAFSRVTIGNTDNTKGISNELARLAAWIEARLPSPPDTAQGEG